MSSPIYVLAGEDRTDREVLKTIIETVNPSMRGQCRELNEYVRLVKAKDDVLASRLNKLSRLARAIAERNRAPLGGIIVHEDLDGVTGEEYRKKREHIAQCIRRVVPKSSFALAAWETEAWLLLFPHGLDGYAKGWNVPASLRKCDTGKLQDAKEVIIRRVSTAARRYRESDAPKIIKRTVADAKGLSSDSTNESFADFLEEVQAF